MKDGFSSCCASAGNSGEHIIEEMLHVEQTAHGGRKGLPEDVGRPIEDVVDVVVGQQDVRDI